MIRKASVQDLTKIMEIFDTAKSFMRTTGNLKQWIHGYPSEDLVRSDMEKGQSYVVEIDGVICGVFTMLTQDDPTYGYIEGTWVTKGPYLTVHRIASSGAVCGIGVMVFAWVKEYGIEHQYCSIRVDTHADNIPMQNLVCKLGFQKCGIIYLENGDPRLAYEQPIDWLESEV